MKTLKNRQKVRKFLIFTSFLFFPATYYYFSPYLPFEGIQEKIISGSIMLFAGLFVSSLFFGRFFCGWICPAGGLQDCVMTFRTAAVKRLKIRWIKFVIWALWLGLYFFLLISSDGVLRADFFYQTDHGFSVSSLQSLILYLMITGFLFFLPLVIGRRASCHIVCWMAPFMIAGRKLRNTAKWPALRLSADNEKCISCGRCSRDCPMSIDVMENVLSGKMEDQDCILCGICADSCPKDVISLGFSAG